MLRWLLLRRSETSVRAEQDTGPATGAGVRLLMFSFSSRPGRTGERPRMEAGGDASSSRAFGSVSSPFAKRGVAGGWWGQMRGDVVRWLENGPRDGTQPLNGPNMGPGRDGLVDVSGGGEGIAG